MKYQWFFSKENESDFSYSDTRFESARKKFLRLTQFRRKYDKNFPLCIHIKMHEKEKGFKYFFECFDYISGDKINDFEIKFRERQV